MPSSEGDEPEVGGEPGFDALGQLVRGVAHELNNVLGVILNYASLLTDQVTDPAALDDLGEIRKAAERAAELAHQLTAASRRPSTSAAEDQDPRVDG